MLPLLFPRSDDKMSIYLYIYWCVLVVFVFQFFTKCCYLPLSALWVEEREQHTRRRRERAAAQAATHFSHPLLLEGYCHGNYNDRSWFEAESSSPSRPTKYVLERYHYNQYVFKHTNQFISLLIEETMWESNADGCRRRRRRSSWADLRFFIGALYFYFLNTIWPNCRIPNVFSFF